MCVRNYLPVNQCILISFRLHRVALLLLFLLLCWPGVVQAQNALPDEYDLHYSRAHTYSDASLYGPAIDELNAAIDYATGHAQEERCIEAGIALGELLRKTGDYEKGLLQLDTLKRASAYPPLQVRRLGRIAAIYSEWQAPPEINGNDSALCYLDSALKLSANQHLPAEEASLYNELGYHTYGTDHEKGLQYLLHSTTLFIGLRDTHNYVGAMTNVLRCNIAQQDTGRAGSVIRELVPLIKNRKWYSAEIELYRLAASFELLFRHDSIAALRWSTMAGQSSLANLEATNSAQVNAFRTLYDTRKLQGELQAQQEALDRETQRTRELIFFSLLLGLFAVVVIALLLRERALLRRLKVTNAELEMSTEKYKVLMVESNHRIKNNLQMVISMLHYSENEAHDYPREAFHRMAQKIRTVSALHHHLSADVHNELVGLDVYFTAIAGLYNDIAPGIPEIHCRVAPVGIRSERIVYFGLILNEMMANTIAHRSTENENSRIEVCVTESGEHYRFTYDDHSTHDPLARKGTGSKLIAQLIDRVGGTAFSFNPANGHYHFIFHG